MDFGSITNSLPTNTNSNNGQKYNTTLNNFLDSHGFMYNYSSVNFTGEGQTIEGFGTTPEYSPSDDPYTKAINFFYAFDPIWYIEKTVDSSGTFSVWYGCTLGSTDCTITKNGAVEDSLTTGDSDNRRRRVDIQVEAGDVIKIEEAYNIMLLYAVIYPYAYSVINFADVVTSVHTGLKNPPDVNPNTDVNTLLTSHGFNYQYTNINYEGEGIVRPGGNGNELDSNSYNYTKAITMFYYGGTDGYIEKTVNGSGTLKVVYGSANDGRADWTGAVAIDTGSGLGYVEVDTVNGVEYKEFTTSISAGDKFKVYEKSIGVFMLYAVEYPGA